MSTRFLVAILLACIQSGTARDSFGRTIATLDARGVTTSISWNDWNEAEVLLAFDADGNAFSRTRNIFTSQGRRRAINEQLDPPTPEGSSERVRHTWHEWLEGGLLQRTRVGTVSSMSDLILPADAIVRMSATEMDDEGRITTEEVGESTGFNQGFTQVIGRQRVLDFEGDQPLLVHVEEPLAGDASYPLQTFHDALGRVIKKTDFGSFTTEIDYDEAGNVVEVQSPGISAPYKSTYDSRGFPLTQTSPNGDELTLTYDALGNLRKYTDESSAATVFHTDPLGRIIKTVYPDGTSEETIYEDNTGAVLATKNRADQWLSYQYEPGGQLRAVVEGPLPSAGTVLRRIVYDSAGRVARMANEDFGIEYDEYDFLGHPRMNRFVRYTNGTGTQDEPDIAERWTQNRRWNEFDEIIRWSMPAAGTLPPTSFFGGGWRTWIDQQYDAGGNLVRQQDASSEIGAADGGMISEATSRGPEVKLGSHLES